MLLWKDTNSFYHAEGGIAEINIFGKWEQIFAKNKQGITKNVACCVEL